MRPKQGIISKIKNMRCYVMYITYIMYVIGNM